MKDFEQQMRLTKRNILTSCAVLAVLVATLCFAGFSGGNAVVNKEVGATATQGNANSAMMQSDSGIVVETSFKNLSDIEISHATLMATSSAKGSWIKSGNRWWYRNSNGTYPKSCSTTIDGQTYRFDSAGWMRTGWILENGKWYWHGGANDGAMHKGWALVGGTWYYLNPSDGVMKTGFYDVSGKRYYSTSSGAMKTGWVNANNKWYWMDGSGAMAKNRWISGTYWVGSDGVMATNAWVDNGRYYVNGSGAWVPQPASSSTSSSAGAVANTQTVYWVVTSKDKVYHTQNCRALANAKSSNIRSGTLSEAKSKGFTTLCKNCSH